MYGKFKNSFIYSFILFTFRWSKYRCNNTIGCRTCQRSNWTVDLPTNYLRRCLMPWSVYTFSSHSVVGNRRNMGKRWRILLWLNYFTLRRRWNISQTQTTEFFFLFIKTSSNNLVFVVSLFWEKISNVFATVTFEFFNIPNLFKVSE
jgi:hypothetical protein